MDENSNIKFQVAGLKWMFEMELLDDKNPAPINVMKMNVLSVSPKIREVEFLIFREGRQILVLLDLSWFTRKVFKKKVGQIFQDVQEVLSQLLPNFRFRVTADPHIMELAIANVKETFRRIDEIRNRDDDADAKPEQSGATTGSTEAQPGTSPSVAPNSQEQPQAEPGLLPKSGPGDSSEQS